MASKRLISLFIASIFSLTSAEQHVLNDRTGVLRRFSEGTVVQQVLDVAQEHNLDVWHASSSTIDIYSPDSTTELPNELQNLPHIVTPMPQPVLTPGLLRSSWNSSSLGNSTFHNSYHPLYEVEAFVKELADVYPNVTRLINLGHSAEGREMFGITLSTGKYEEEEEEEEDRKKRKKKKKKKKAKSRTGHEGEKLGFVIVGAQHAREWIATATSLYVTHALLADESEAHSLSSLLQHFDFHIVPVPNPDGYDYTWESDRYWYKNRQVLGPYSKCIGLDMNRNWGYKWKAGSRDNRAGRRPAQSSDPCSFWYPGSRPFESPEVNNIANWISTLPDIVGFINLRSYGQMLSSPYSYTCKRVPKDAEDQIEAAFGASQALKSVHGTEFQVGSLCSMLYRAPGNILDWMYSRKAVKYSYVAHLRDTGTYGFNLPEQWIRPSGEEITRLVDYIARFVARQANRPFKKTLD